MKENKESVDVIQRVGSWVFDVRDIAAISDIKVCWANEYYFPLVKLTFDVIFQIPNIHISTKDLVKIEDGGWSTVRNQVEYNLDGTRTVIPPSEKFTLGHYSKYNTGDHNELQRQNIDLDSLLKKATAFTHYLAQYNKLHIAWEYYKRKSEPIEWKK